MSKPTPGPWHVPKYAWFQIAAADGLPGHAAIATVYECAHSGRDKNEATANARLIAAAPELLAVAKAIRDSRPEYDTVEENEQLKTRLALAIARAEEDTT